MKLLVDANLSPRLAAMLHAAGFDADHVADHDLLHADDGAIFDHAAAGGLVVITADSDFPMLLALRRAVSPSVVHLRHVNELTVEQHAALLVANLPAVRDDLRAGAIVSLSPVRMAVRALPIR